MTSRTIIFFALALIRHLVASGGEFLVAPRMYKARRDEGDSVDAGVK